MEADQLYHHRPPNPQLDPQLDAHLDPQPHPQPDLQQTQIMGGVQTSLSLTPLPGQRTETPTCSQVLICVQYNDNRYDRSTYWQI